LTYGVPIPAGELQFCDGNGHPIAGGYVYMYEAGTTAPAITWQDANRTTPNTNPILLDGDGRCRIWGAGQTLYRQVVQDRDSNLLFDQLIGFPATDIVATSLTVTGATQLGDLTVTGATQLAGLTAGATQLASLAVTGATQLGPDLHVAGSVFADGELTAGPDSAHKIELGWFGNAAFVKFRKETGPGTGDGIVFDPATDEFRFFSPEGNDFFIVNPSITRFYAGLVRIFHDLTVDGRVSIGGTSSDFFLDYPGGSAEIHLSPLASIRVTGDGKLQLIFNAQSKMIVDDAGVGFNSHNPPGIPTITGSVSGATASVLTQVLQILDQLGLIVDGTTA
jgi:hypothetical protein